jgi:hypothetical protein
VLSCSLLQPTLQCGQLLNSGKPPNGVERRVERGDIYIPLDTRLTKIEVKQNHQERLMYAIIILQLLIGGWDGILHLDDILKLLGHL